MDFVIWGAGKRGKIAAAFIGYQHIKAFIDSEKMLWGTKYNGIPVISIDQYLERYRDYLIIVSPYQYAEIIDSLNQKGIKEYLLFGHCPSEIYSGQLKSLDEVDFPKLDYDKAAILGLSLFGLLLHEYFMEKGTDVPVLMQGGDMDIRRYLQFPVINERTYVYTADRIILQAEKPAAGKEAGGIDLYHLAEYTGKFHNPALRKFKDIHKNKKCFIIGNGPSLTAADLNKLSRQNEICFGMNGIPLIFEKTVWRPDYYVCEDDKAMDLFGDSVLHSGIRHVLISDAGSEFVEKAKTYANVDIFHMTIEDYAPDLPVFSSDMEKVLYCGYTVTYACLQVAMYMGFQDIYLLGMDFDYADGNTMEVKHFAEEYHKDKMKVNPCRRKENLLAYEAARQYAEGHDVRIYNATRGGKLEVFERVDFDSL